MLSLTPALGSHGGCATKVTRDCSNDCVRAPWTAPVRKRSRIAATRCEIGLGRQGAGLHFGGSIAECVPSPGGAFGLSQCGFTALQRRARVTGVRTILTLF